MSCIESFAPKIRRLATVALLAAPLLVLLAGDVAAQAPSGSQGGEARLERLKLNGPRFGFTAFTGDVADRRDLADLEPLMTQFGWQFETRLVSTEGGSQALLEWIALVGGVEQSELNLSLATLAGYRIENGLEFGVGPNISYNKDADDFTTSMLVAGGATLPFGDMYVPVNLAVGIAEGGPRFTVLIGWIVGS